MDWKQFQVALAELNEFYSDYSGVTPKENYMQDADVYIRYTDDVGFVHTVPLKSISFEKEMGMIILNASSVTYHSQD